MYYTFQYGRHSLGNGTFLWFGIRFSRVKSPLSWQQCTLNSCSVFTLFTVLQTDGYLILRRECGEESVLADSKLGYWCWTHLGCSPTHQRANYV